MSDDNLQDELAEALDSNDINNQNDDYEVDNNYSDDYNEQGLDNQDNYSADEQEANDNSNQENKPVTIGELKELVSSLVQTITSVSNSNMSRAINNNPIDLEREKSETERIEKEINEMLDKSGIELNKDEIDDSVYKPVSKIAKNVSADLIKEIFPLLKNYISSTLKSNIDPKINAIGQDLTNNRLVTLKESIDREFPNYSQYHNKDTFNNYLREIIPDAGLSRLDAFNNAIATNDRRTIFNILKGYESKYINKSKPTLATNKINGNINRDRGQQASKNVLDGFYKLQSQLEKGEITADRYRDLLSKLYGN